MNNPTTPIKPPITCLNRHIFAHIPEEKEIYKTFKSLPYAEYIQYRESDDVWFSDGNLITLHREEWLKEYHERNKEATKKEKV